MVLCKSVGIKNLFPASPVERGQGKKLSLQRNTHYTDYHVIRKSFKNEVRKFLVRIQGHFK